MSAVQVPRTGRQEDLEFVLPDWLYSETLSKEKLYQDYVFHDHKSSLNQEHLGAWY